MINTNIIKHNFIAANTFEKYSKIKDNDVLKHLCRVLDLSIHMSHDSFKNI